MKSIVTFTALVGLALISIDKGSCDVNWLYQTVFTVEVGDQIRNQFHCDNDDVTEEEKLVCIGDNLESFVTIIVKKFLTETTIAERVVTSQQILKRLRKTFGTMLNSDIDHLVFSPNLPKFFFEPTMGALSKAFKKDISNSLENTDGYILPLESACAALPTRDIPNLSAKDICPTLGSCTPESRYVFGNACPREGSPQECQVKTAIPMMLGMFFYKFSFALVDKFCSQRCADDYDREDGSCPYDLIYAELEHEVKLIKAFVSMVPEKPFDQFYRDALNQNVYSDLTAAMQILGGKEEEFSATAFACREIEAEVACPIAQIYQTYVLLKKLKDEKLSPGQTRDLQLLENIDHGKMIERLVDSVRHFELLSAIDRLDDNLRAQVQGISEYFNGVATYDQGIAEQDVAFTKGKLEEFEELYAKLQTKLADDVRIAMESMVIVLSFQLADEIAQLVAIVAENCNPFKAIFSGVDADEMIEQSGEIASAAADLAYGASLFAALPELVEDTDLLAKDLSNNMGQLKTLNALVEKIKTNQVSSIGEDADQFVQDYGGYTPKVDRHRLARNTALWSAFKEATCNLLTGVESLTGSVAKGVTNGLLLCERLEGTIAEFDALRENMFDFQFELVDSLALVVRGNIAAKLSSAIQDEEQDFLQAGQLLNGFLMTQIQIQSQAWLYCDKITYRNGGRVISMCSVPSGLFTDTDLNNIAAYQDNKRYTSIDRTVYIPSRPTFNGDLGFISIPTLAREKKVSFRLPVNVNWLQEHHWSLIGETAAPYVESFSLYLPNKEYKTGSDRTQTSTRLTITADTGSYISASSPVVYKLPTAHTSFINSYEEGYGGSCSGNEIDNPYSLCENLPKICQVSTTVAGDSLLPTILSRWKVSYTVQSGSTELDWIAPNTTTTLLFKAKLKLRMLNTGGKKKRSHIFGEKKTRKSKLHASKGKSRKLRKALKKPTTNAWRSDELVQDGNNPKGPGCCVGNQFRTGWQNNQCEDCPAESTKYLGGLFCEGNVE